MPKKSNLPNPVRNTLYAWAKRNGIKSVQVSAAEALGVTRSAVAQWLSTGYVSDRHLIAYSQLVGCAPYEVSSSAHVIRSANM